MPVNAALDLAEASAVLRGQRTGTTRDERARATALILTAVDERHRLSIFSSRLLDALDAGDDRAAAVARRRLREVLDEVG
ncbi:hypothetical protein [Pseudonocardia alni]|uniref:hypothetical protein n=1 Tax=Pseudonocardia alni TaxID=33907 RepID=UPI0033273C5F